MKIIILGCAIAISAVFIGCNKEEANPAQTSSNAEAKPVPFFEVAKGDSISKNVFREKPVLQGSEAATILFSTEDKLKAQGSSSGSGYILDLKTSVRTGNNAPATMDGYTKIPVDLNEGAGGKYIYLYYIKTLSSASALKNLGVVTGSGPILSTTEIELGRSFANNGWTDLNEGAGGAFVYLYGTRDSYFGGPIADVLIASSSSSSVSFAGWIKVGVDLNRGAGGKYIYIFFRR